MLAQRRTVRDSKRAVVLMISTGNSKNARAASDTVFAGSPKTVSDAALAFLLFPVEIISTTARLLSLTVRLWANIFASDLIYGIFVSLLAGPAIWGWGKAPVFGVLLGIFPAILPIAF